MTTKYEQKIDAIGQTVARIDERQIALSNRLYDKQGDIPRMLKHLETINSTNYEQQVQIDHNTTAIKELNKGRLPEMLKSKWFWVLVVIVILALLGLSGTIDIQELLLAPRL